MVLPYKLAQYSSCSAKPSQQGLKAWPTPLTWFRLQSKDVYTNAQVPTENTFKLIAADPFGVCTV